MTDTPLKQKVKTTLVLGVGNLFRRDDGAGIHVIRELERAGFPESVRLLDGGTAGLDLVTYLEGVDRLIIVDALIGGRPGDIKILAEEETREAYYLSGHLGRLSDILDMTAALWKRPQTVIVGITAADCEGYGDVLSPEVYPAVGRAVSLISGMLQTAGAEGPGAG